MGVEPSRGAHRAVSVVVVNHGSHALLRAHLAAATLDRALVDVVVVDNFSTTRERDAVRSLAAEQSWTLVELAENRGFGAGMNAGVARAARDGATVVVLLNPDAVVSGEVVVALGEHCSDRPLEAVSPRIEDSSGRVVFQGAELQLHSGRLRGLRADGPEVDAMLHSRLTGPALPWLGGACLALSVELLARVGGFDERYFLYWEDVDLSHRVLAAGGRLVVRRDLLAVHDEGGTQDRAGEGKSALYYRYNCRNRLVFAAANLPRSEVVRWIARTPSESTRILLRGGRRQLLHPVAPVRAAMTGSLVGVGLALVSLVVGRGRRWGGVGVAAARGAELVGRRVLVAHPGAELYGSDRVLLESVAALVGAGATVTVAVPGDGPLVERLVGHGAQVRVCRTAVLRKSALSPRGLVALGAEVLAAAGPGWRLLREVRPDVVYVSTVTIPAWSVLARIARARVLVHGHEAERTQPAVVRRVLALPLSLAHRVVVNSRFSRDVLLGAAPGLAQRTTVLLNGVPGPSSATLARPELVGAVQLLYLGRIAPRKGPQTAVATLGELVARGVDAELVLLGSVYPGYEWFAEQLSEQIGALGLRHRVRQVGFDPDVWSHLAAADVVLVPSLLDEPFGNTAVEAVLAARPVIVSATSGLVEAVAGSTSARLVEPALPGAWADAVQEVLARWTQLREEAYADAGRARDRFDPARYGSQLVDVVAGLVGPTT